MANIYHFKKIQDEVLRHLDEDGDTDLTLTSVKNAINQAHMRRLSERDWPFMLWPTPVTFSTVSSQSLYALHSEFHKPYYFFNQTTKMYLIEMNPRQLGPSGVRWNTDTGNLSRFAMWGRYPVSAQPASAGTISIVSSSALDTAATYAVTIRGTSSDGSGVVEESITPTGTTTATGSSTFSNPILSITLARPWNGTLTVTSGSTTLLTLSAGEVGRSYPYLYALSQPTTTNTIEYRFYRQPRLLEDDYDLPDIPPPFQQILVWDALIDLATYDSGISQGDLLVWQKRAKDLEDAMILSLEEGESLEAEPRYVRYMGEEPDSPRIYTN